jgi:hypothetical protein
MQYGKVHVVCLALQHWYFMYNRLHWCVYIKGPKNLLKRAERKEELEKRTGLEEWFLLFFVLTKQ